MLESSSEGNPLRAGYLSTFSSYFFRQWQILVRINLFPFFLSLPTCTSMCVERTGGVSEAKRETFRCNKCCMLFSLQPRKWCHQSRKSILIHRQISISLFSHSISHTPCLFLVIRVCKYFRLNSTQLWGRIIIFLFQKEYVEETSLKRKRAQTVTSSIYSSEDLAIDAAAEEIHAPHSRRSWRD